MNNIHLYNDTDQGPPTWLSCAQKIAGKLWLAGHGAMPCKIMFIGEFPGKYELKSTKFFAGHMGEALYEKIAQHNININTCYFTNVVKFQPEGKKPSASEIKICAPLLEEEINRAEPEIIITLGREALIAVLGRGYSLTDFNGTVVPHPTRQNVKVIPLFNPGYVLKNPAALEQYNAAWQVVAATLNNTPTVEQNTDWVIYRSTKEIETFTDWLVAKNEPVLLVIDAEWHGKHWQDPNRWIRTLQIGYDIGKVAVIEFYDQNARFVGDNLQNMWSAIGKLLTHNNIGLAGHNIRADGEWIASYGINIRKNVVYDSMIAEHTINGAGVFGLDALTLKYTRMGRYDMELLDWKTRNKDLCSKGFGFIPSSILIPYAAKDVDAPRRIMQSQIPKLQPYMHPRGSYPSIWDVDMHAQDILYELEQTGLLVDTEQLNKLTKVYQAGRRELAGKLNAMSMSLGFKEFNPSSPLQVKKLLFETLGMTPVTTTAGKPWANVLNLPPNTQEKLNPSTDKDSLTILADQDNAHPIVGILRDYRKVDYVCNHWLCDPVTSDKFDETSRGGGLRAKIWPDGRLHARFSQLKETGRFGSSNPNVQNWMKRAEGELTRILIKDLNVVAQEFGADSKLPKLRSIIIPTPGHVFMEADWKQAEMFVLAALSDDDVMWDALTTPGRDLHDLTAIEAFKITVCGPDGNVVPDSYLLELAAKDPNYEADDSEFSKFQNQLLYVDQRGRTLTRKEFKSGIRVSAKNLNFGIPYGRGSQDIAIQVKSETGSTESIPNLKQEIDVMMATWKEKTYPKAWKYMEYCASTVEDPGVIVNPWGRTRHFPKTNSQEQIAKMGREAQNFPIQSTVADTCLVTLKLMADYRQKYNLKFKIVNQIHDAILVETPIEEIEATKEMFHATMGSIEIPISATRPLKLGIDIDVMERWAT